MIKACPFTMYVAFSSRKEGKQHIMPKEMKNGKMFPVN